MDDRLFRKLDEKIPSFNERVAKNLAVEFMGDVEKYITQIFQSSERDYPEDLRFLRIEHVDPHTDFIKSMYKDKYDVTRSDVYMVKVMFEFKGKELPPFYMNLPYIRKGGMITIKGSNYLISPVVIDEGLSVGPNSIFIHVNKAKITFTRLHYAMFADGGRFNGHVIYSDIYNGKPPAGTSKKSLRITHKMESLIAQYLFAMRGVTDTFKHYLGTDVVVGRGEITQDLYPPDKWVICESLTEIKPTKLTIRFSKPHHVRLAIPRESWNLETQSLALSMFYILDHHFDRVEGEDLDDKNLWRMILGLTLRPEESNDIACLNSAVRNLNSLNSHLDSQVRVSLATIGIRVDDIYDLFVEIIKTYTHRVVQSSHELATMYGKRMTLLRYLLTTITSKIFNLGYKLQARKKDNNLRENDVVNIIYKHISTKDIKNINYNHPEVESVNAPTDNMLPKLSSRVCQQNRLISAKTTDIFTADMILDTSIGEAGNLIVTSGDKTGRSRINPWVCVAEDGTIIRNPELVGITSRTQREIDR